MKHTLPWNVTGIPPEAREIARAAASREGISVGDWLTRRIVAEKASVESAAEEPVSNEPNPDLSQSNGQDEGSRGGNDHLTAGLARAQTETHTAIRRIDDVLRAVTNRLETNERSQNEVHRAMSSAASEISAATRDQAQAFQHLTRRLEQVERHTDTGALRDAVRALHQGLSRLADQIAKTANDSGARITTLAADVEVLAGDIAVIRGESKDVAESVENRFAALDARIQQSEERIASSLQLEGRLSQFEERLQHNEKSANASPRLEDSLAKVEAGISSAEQRLQEAFGRQFAAAERNIENLASRLHHAEQRTESDQGMQDTLKSLSTRVDAAEKSHREISNELKASAEDTSKRLQTIEMAMPLGDSLPPSVASIASSTLADFETPPRFDDEALSAAGSEGSGRKDAFAHEPQHSSAENYLAQARRAAQAAGDSDIDKRSRARGRIAGSGEANNALETKSRRFSRAVAVAAVLLLVLAAGFLVTRNVVRGQEGGRARTAAAPSTVASLEPAPLSLAAAPLPQNIVPTATPAPDSAPAPTSPHAATSTGSESETSLARMMAEAKTGDMKAALVLGMKYADGDGVPVNDAEAARWLQQAAEAGEPVAQYRLGPLYEKGRGLTADHHQAIRWYSEAAKRGNRKAMHNLAVAYADGAGTQRNFTEAAHWFRAAAELGLTDSQFNLAVLYERGLGVKPSLSEAYKWYAIAAAAGDAESKTRLEALGSQIPAADRDGADKTAKAYRPQPLNVAANDGP